MNEKFVPFAPTISVLRRPVEAAEVHFVDEAAQQMVDRFVDRVLMLAAAEDAEPLIGAKGQEGARATVGLEPIAAAVDHLVGVHLEQEAELLRQVDADSARGDGSAAAASLHHVHLPHRFAHQPIDGER